MNRLLFFILLSCCLTGNAVKYEIASMKDVSITRAGKQLKNKDIYDSETDIISVVWTSSNGYYVLKDKSNGITIPVRQTTIPKNSDNTSFNQQLKKYLTNVKNCSSRAADNELQGGLGNYLSQTFYLSASDSELSAISIATDLIQDADNYFILGYPVNRKIVEARIAPSSARLCIRLADLSKLNITAEEQRLRCRVWYRTADGKKTPITETLNIIILP